MGWPRARSHWSAWPSTSGSRGGTCAAGRRSCPGASVLRTVTIRVFSTLKNSATRSGDVGGRSAGESSSTCREALNSSTGQTSRTPKQPRSRRLCGLARTGGSREDLHVLPAGCRRPPSRCQVADAPVDVLRVTSHAVRPSAGCVNPNGPHRSPCYGHQRLQRPPSIGSPQPATSSLSKATPTANASAPAAASASTGRPAAPTSAAVVLGDWLPHLRAVVRRTELTRASLEIAACSAA